MPLEDLFEHVDTVGPFKVMLPVRSSGEAQELYGIAYSVFQFRKWSTQIQMGNSVEHLGAPQSFYEGRWLLPVPKDSRNRPKSRGFWVF